MTLRVDIQLYGVCIGACLFRYLRYWFYCILRFFFLQGYGFRSNLFHLLFAELDSVDFVCIEDNCLKREIQQPSEKVTAHEDYQPYKIVLVETCCDDYRDKKRNHTDGYEDEA